jgi:DNA uptake protein ComE-like DNA-binding protein
MPKRTLSHVAAGQDPRLEAAQSLGFLVGAWICLILSLSFAAGALHRAARPPAGHPVERINPNNAPTASLVRLPGIGVTRARAIVAFRDHAREQGGHMPVFRCAEDLAQIRGIGPATIDGLRPWLQFDPPPDLRDGPPLR